MANETTALAAAGEGTDLLSSSDIQAILQGEIPAGTPTEPVAAAAHPTPQKTGEVKITVAGEELTQAQIEERLSKPNLTPEIQKRLEIADNFLAMPAEQQRVLIQAAEQLQKGINPLAQQSPSTLSVSELDVPADAKIKPQDWDEMSDEGKFNYALASGIKDHLEGKIRDLAAIVEGQGQYLRTLHVGHQDSQIAAALRVKGWEGCTPEDVAALRAEGISDPVKAITSGRLAVPQKEAAVAVTPVAEGGGSSQAEKFFDADTVSMDQCMRLIKLGYQPKAEKDRTRLAHLMNSVIEKKTA